MPEVATTFNIELRDSAGNLRQYLTPFVDQVQWEWNKIGGCGQCKFSINKPYRDIVINAADDIQIRVKSGATSKLVYRGWVSKTVPTLSRPQKIVVEARGYYEKLKRLVVSDSGATKSYSGDLVSTIVDDVVDTFVVANTEITKGTIDVSNYAIDSLSFKATVEDVLRTLAEIEGRVEYGVDEDLAFFWRAESDTIAQKFIIGNNVKSLERRIDYDKLANKIYFEGGNVSDTPFLRTGEATESQTSYFLAEKIVTNSSITTQSVSDRLISTILRRESSPRLLLRFSVANTDIRMEDNIPLGSVAAFDADYDQVGNDIWGTTANGGSNLVWGINANGGSNRLWGGLYRGQVSRIKYKLSNTDERYNIEVQMGEGFLETASLIKRIELDLDSIRQRG